MLSSDFIASSKVSQSKENSASNGLEQKCLIEKSFQLQGKFKEKTLRNKDVEFICQERRSKEKKS